jgi:hypothetical protein
MKKNLSLIAFMATIVILASLGAIEVAAEQDIPILGYPYNTSSWGGMGIQGYSLYGSLFTLNGDANITSMSCEMAMYFAYPNPTGVHYRFAIYQDNAGKVGTLVAQTKEGIAISDIQGNMEQWRTADFDSPVSLQAGKYWLIVIYQTKNVGIHNLSFLEGHENNLAPWNQSRIVMSSDLSNGSLPPSLESLHPFDKPAGLIAIYASGQGTPSVLPPPPSTFYGPTPSRVFLSFKNVDPSTGMFQIVGNLTSNNTSVPNSDLTFSYRNSRESDTSLQEFSTVTTDSNGRFAVDWQPPGVGNYNINATYHGSDLYRPAFDGINVLVTQFNGDNQVFSVESNSTVTDIVYNPESGELNLSVTGQTGTTGFVDVYVSKSLVGNVSAIQAFIDQNPVEFTVSETEDNWILHFNYHHSSHNIVFNLSGAEAVPEATVSSASPTSTPTVPELSWLAIVPLLLSLFFVAVILRHRKTISQNKPNV